MRSCRWITILATFGLLFVLTLTSPAQEVPPQTSPSAGVIRINVDLVQVDAVVTDSKGRPVTDLRAEDFELSQDGVRQKINSVEFVRVRDQAPSAPILQVVSQPRNSAVPPPPRTVNLRPDQIRRTIALVVDDLGLSFDSVVHVRDSLKNWVDTEMQQGDLVAVVRTSAGMGSLQRFTMDKQLLRAAIDLIRANYGRVGTSSFEPRRGALPTDGVLDTSLFQDELDHAYLVGSLGAIQYVVRGLRDLPGRKSLVLFSESMRFTYLEGPGLVASRALTNATGEERLRKLADEASRSSVVIYAVDPRGVAYTGLTAEDNVHGLEDEAVRQTFSDRSTQLTESRDGMIELTQRTGGLFAHDNNDVGRMLREVIDDGDGYYLIGYQPDLSTFGEGTGKVPYHKISLRVNRPGLSVRSRNGFYGRSDDRSLPASDAQRTQIARALSSPFASDDVGIRLTGLFFPSETVAGAIKIFLHLDVRDVTFAEEADGTRTAEVDIAEVAFDAEGEQLDAIGETSKIRVQKDDYERVMKDGIVFGGQLPVKKPGGYQLRVAVRDTTSKKLGTAMQFIDVPDVKKGRLTLSGIVVAERLQTPAPGTVSGDSIKSESPQATPALRIFKPGAAIVYAYEVLNARADSEKKHQLDAQIRLFRDGQQVFEGRPEEIKPVESPNSKLLGVTGGIQLSQIAPGHYVLQIIVADNLRYDKYRLAAQAIDFDVQQ